MLAIFAIAPHSGEKHLSRFVAKTLEKVRASGLDHQITAMGTLVEGEPEEVFNLIRDCHIMMREHGSRIGTKIWIDDQVGKSGRIRDKVKSVEDKLDT
jgi:uncharacterized protein (TIGR00106 family)